MGAERHLTFTYLDARAKNNSGVLTGIMDEQFLETVYDLEPDLQYSVALQHYVAKSHFEHILVIVFIDEKGNPRRRIGATQKYHKGQETELVKSAAKSMGIKIERFFESIKGGKG